MKDSEIEFTQKGFNQRILQAHCQSPSSQPLIQSFVKELAKPTKKIELKTRPFKKNKKSQHTGDPDRKN